MIINNFLKEKNGNSIVILVYKVNNGDFMKSSCKNCSY